MTPSIPLPPGVTPEPFGPDQESVWDYPRPPAVEPVSERIHIQFRGVTIVDTTSALRVLETSHPPNYYLPLEAVLVGVLRDTPRRTWCEWKGEARYFDVVVEDRVASRAAWWYPSPQPGFEALRDHVAFYAAPMDACFVGSERARPQPGLYYGGWITKRIRGPFKGERGSEGW